MSPALKERMAVWAGKEIEDSRACQAHQGRWVSRAPEAKLVRRAIPASLVLVEKGHRDLADQKVLLARTLLDRQDGQVKWVRLAVLVFQALEEHPVFAPNALIMPPLPYIIKTSRAKDLRSKVNLILD